MDTITLSTSESLALSQAVRDRIDLLRDAADSSGRLAEYYRRDLLLLEDILAKLRFPGSPAPE